MTYGTTLIACYIRTVAFKMTGFPIIIACRVRAIGFKITGLTAAITKLRSFFKKIIGAHMASRQTKMTF